MPDFLDPADFKRLTTAVAWSEKKLQEFRLDRMDAVREFAGFHYGENSTDDKRPINVIQIGATVYHRKISVKNPRAMVATRYRELLASAEDFKLALNVKLSEMDLERSLNATGMEALFACGMVKIGLDPETGEIFVDPILFEDAILDLSATAWRELGYIGHRYRLDRETFKERYGRKEAERAESGAPWDLSGDRGEVRSQTLAIGTARVEEYKEHVECIELFLPQERQIVTYEDGGKEPLDVRPWQGPKRSFLGPYRVLSFVDVPGNIMPVGPVQFWRDIHEVINSLANKTFRQAERQKTQTLVPETHAADAPTIRDGEDGATLGVSSDPEKIVEKSWGGANQVNLGMVMWLRQMFDYVSGGTSLLGGMGANSETLGQDQLLLQSAGTQVEDMQHRMLSFTRDVIGDAAWWLWTDPIAEVNVSRSIPGMEMEYDYVWDQSRRKGDFFQYNFDVEPYSQVRRTPQQRFASLMNLVERVAVPLYPGMQAADMDFDYEYLFKLAAEMEDIPEFNRVIRYRSGEMQPNQQPKMPEMQPQKRPDPSGGPGNGSNRGVEADLMSKLLTTTSGPRV